MSNDSFDRLDGVTGALTDRVIAGRYRVVREVSSGANTVIADAVDLAEERPVTLKVVHPELADTDDFRAAFRRAGALATSLRHPNVGAVLAWGDVEVAGGSTVFWVGEHLAGGSLRDLLDRGRLLTPSQALVVGLEACRGLEAAHQRGLIHSEVTPSKLVFGADGRLRVIDMCMARLLGAVAWQEPSSVATHVARYASPEQAQGLQIDATTDVYALSLSLVEAVTGSVPFAGDSTVSTLAARVGKLLPVSADLGSLASVLERAARPEAQDRWSPTEFVEALVRAAPKLPRPEPVPVLTTGLFDTSELRRPSDPTGGFSRPSRTGALPTTDATNPAGSPTSPADDDPDGPGDEAPETTSTASGAVMVGAVAAGAAVAAGSAIAAGSERSSVQTGPPSTGDPRRATGTSSTTTVPASAEPPGAVTSTATDSTATGATAATLETAQPTAATPETATAANDAAPASDTLSESSVTAAEPENAPSAPTAPDPGAAVSADDVLDDPDVDAVSSASNQPGDEATPVGDQVSRDEPGVVAGDEVSRLEPVLLAGDPAESSDVGEQMDEPEPSADERAPTHSMTTVAATTGAPVTPTAQMPATSPPSAPVEVFDAEPPRRRWGVIVLVGLLVLVGIGVLSYAGWLLLRTKTHEVPDLVGVDEQVALAEIAGNEWEVTTERTRDDGFPEPDSVIRTVPVAGSSLAEGAEFTLIVSDGPEFRTLPEFVDVPVEEARAILDELALVAVEAEPRVFDEEVADGSVVSWEVEGNPAMVAGGRILPGEVVILTVSQGPEPRPAPDLVGRTVAEAAAEIDALQLGLAQGDEVFSETLEIGRVVSQSPAPGTPIERGGAVSVQVSKGPDLRPIPDVVGQPFEQGRQQIIDAGFTIGDVLGTTEGNIVSLSVDGSEVAAGDRFRLGTAVGIISL